MREGPIESEWLYYRIYLSELDQIDEVLENVVRPGIASWRAELSDLRWFFLRFIDPIGPHLRLRIAANRSSVARLERDWDSRLARSRPTPRMVGKYVYAREYAKFDGVEGMRLAERIFLLSSETVMACAGERMRRMRTAYGAAHLLLSVSALPAKQRLGFLHQYAWYWSGGPQRTRTGVDPAEELSVLAPMAARVVTAASRVLADQRTRDQFIAYRMAFWAELNGKTRREVARTDQFLLFHHTHLMHNRMGVYPLVEARLARLLWAAQLSGATAEFAEKS